MNRYIKNSLYGILTGFLYAFVYSKIINLYPSATIKRIILFAAIGLISAFIYSFMVNVLRKKMGNVLLKNKILLSNLVSSLISVLSCGILFYFFNSQVLASSSSSQELFMVDVQKVTFEIIINFTLISLIVNVTRGILEINKINNTSMK